MIWSCCDAGSSNCPQRLCIPDPACVLPVHSSYGLLFPIDRKSTRLNSSHSQISYAVFCLKKKKKYESSFYPNHQTTEQSPPQPPHSPPSPARFCTPTPHNTPSAPTHPTSHPAPLYAATS